MYSQVVEGRCREEVRGGRFCAVLVGQVRVVSPRCPPTGLALSSSSSSRLHLSAMQNGGVDPQRVTRGHAAAMANPASQPPPPPQPYTLPTLPELATAETDTQGDVEMSKNRKEMEREKKDLELGELLEMMDDWRPIVSIGPSLLGNCLLGIGGVVWDVKGVGETRWRGLRNEEDTGADRTLDSIDPRRGDRLLPPALRIRDFRSPSVSTLYPVLRTATDHAAPSRKRLLALATQRFVSSIATDAFAYARTRTATGSAGRGTKEGPAARAKVSIDDWHFREESILTGGCARRTRRGQS